MNQKICVFLPNWIGDAVMATPTIRILYEYFNNSAVFTALGRPHILELLAGNPWFRHNIPLQVKNAPPEFSQSNIIRQLKLEQFDTALLLPNSIRSALIAWFGKIKKRVGYASLGRRWFLSTAVNIPTYEIPITDYYLNLADTIIGKNAPQNTLNRYRLELHTTPEEEKLGDDVWNNLALQPPEKVLVLNIGAASSIAKQFPHDHAVELARLITDQLGFDVLLNCGPHETRFVKEIVQLANRERVFSLAEQPLNIHTGKICLKRARLTVSTDSGPLHIAAAFGKPTLVLLGPSSETYIANPSLNQFILSRHLPCSPCYAKKKGICPKKHHRCMRELTPQLVFERIRQIINQ
ncbi:MAG: lipopolysaccharide heptosyltransferase II [Planctomycetaceae bacterium]|jgi:heptosyltransferase-2|nr:lipopolysaccharide heptosyltransferase II [Planctomycetaceae bacterium]